MAECDIKNSDHLIANKSSLISSSSLDDNENIQQSSATNLDGKTKRKTHRLKQRFQVVKKLGQGTYGKVQLAINNESGQEVAIKTIKKNKVSNQQDLVRIRREIQIMSSINHPNIIHIFEVFENKDKIVLVMQYASGGELYDYVSYHKALSDMEARRVFRQIATAIYYCHKNKICHRDLKLENILLDEKGNAKIADFGLSNVFDDKHFLQTFFDCWSLGVLLYTLVYGAMPFDGSNFKKLVKQISEANFFEPPEKSPATELIHKLLTPEPKERASIIDICMDPWVNQDSEHLLLQVAEDMSNLTNHAVRLDMLLALAPGSVAATAAAASATPSNDEQPKPADSNVGDNQSNKRPNETNSANDSLADLAGKKTTKKKSKKNLSNEQIMTTTENDLVKQKPEEEKIIDEKPSPESNQEKLIEEKENFETISTPVNEQPPSAKIEENETTTNDKNSSQTSLKSTGSSGSVTKKRGRISIPKIWDDNQEKLKTSSTNSSMGSPRKEPKSPGLFSVSELKKELEQRTKLDTVPPSTTLAKRRDTLADTSELKQQSSAAIMENVKKYKNRSISLNLNQVIDEQTNKTVDADQDDKSKSLNEESPLKSTIKDDGGQFVDEKTSTSKTSSTSSIKSDDKSLAKQIIQKNIAKAKLMEKRQTSVQSTTTTATDLQSGETTPLISIENSTISSMMRNSPNSSTSNVFFRTKSGLNDTLVDNVASGSSTPTTKDINQQLSSSTSIDQSIVVNPAPIARSDGVTTRVEKTSRITIKTIIIMIIIHHQHQQQQHYYNVRIVKVQLVHWIFLMIFLKIIGLIVEFSDAKSLFNNFFGRRSEKLSLRSRAESLERTANFFPGRSTDSIRSERKFPTTYRDRDLFERQGNSSFGSHKSFATCQVIRHKTSQMKTSDNIIPRDIQLNFKLDEQTGGLILNQTNIVPVNLDMMNKNSSTSSTSTSTATATATNELKIEEPSSLLEQLRTFGYKKLVDRRLSDSSSTEDLPTANTVVESSSASMMTSSSNKSSGLLG
ncbi:NUAK SNF1-like kinase 1 [Dermatophagoides pteronyssinus]|uniref:NUAK SNF1-like kinase 1 n=1 Tax=Dermatophagoides pteronyssinus TaxID=6956 RepID=A0ABQ8JG95_DERPT|nr:NUAK SNF1-like kinase 1 [Dermatophagoides pteronyssinus]